ncbi:MAG: hypothetical protein ABJB74_16765 [Gemmatimonas sp.]
MQSLSARMNCVPGRLSVGHFFWLMSLALSTLMLLASCTESSDPPIDIVLSRESIGLVVGDTRGLAVTLSGAKPHETVRWITSAPSIATIQGAGDSAIVTAVGIGTAVVYAVLTSDASIKSKAVNVVVIAPPPALVAVQLSPDTAKYFVGQSFTVTPRIVRENPSVEVSYSFASSAPNVATITRVGEGGVVVAVAPGTTTLTVTATGSGAGYTQNVLTAKQTVTVSVLSNQPIQIAAGLSHTCALTDAGFAYCWGLNSTGQLGTGNVTSQSVPTPTNGSVPFTAIAPGAKHTCALAITTVVYCWGYGVQGQLGNGTTTDRTTPTPVTGTQSFSAVTAGGSHSCALTTQGAAYCWGSGANGKLGNGAIVDRTVPELVTMSGIALIGISAGGSHTCGTAVTGIYCWGSGTFGQLGDGANVDRTLPTRVPSGQSFLEVVAGTNHTCARASDGPAYCWGAGSHGQLGNSSTADRSIPALVEGGLQFFQITAGDSHTCGLVNTGAAFCWGAGEQGQLGNGSTSNKSSPSLVSGDLKFSRIAAGANHTCGIATIEGRPATYCWGASSDGQTGVGTQNSSTPQRVAFPP